MFKNEDLIVWNPGNNGLGGVICYYGAIKHLVTEECWVRLAFNFEVHKYLNINF